MKTVLLPPKTILLQMRPFGGIAFSALMLILRNACPAVAEITCADLHPAEAASSGAYGVSGSHEAGYVRYLGSNGRAALWSGTAKSFISLHPQGAESSICWGAGGDQQVGFVIFDLDEKTFAHAALWTGTAESFQDLHPPWADSPRGPSCALSTTGSEQSGWVRFEPGFLHSAKWYGSGANSVDLGTNQPTWNLCPAGFGNAYVRAVTGNYQAGVAVVGTDDSPPLPGAPPAYWDHAALWHGTPESFVDLHPAGATGSSGINAAYGPYQVGMADINGQAHAGLWSGTAESFVDLHAALGTGYVSSYASAVWTDGSTTRVVGTAQVVDTWEDHAVLWTVRPPRVEVSKAPVGLTLSWSATEPGFAMERATALSSGKWEEVPASLSSSEGRWTSTVKPAEGACFFRLRQTLSQ